MGLTFEEGDFKISQYRTTEKAELRLDDAVGFSRQEDGTFAMVGDFYHSDNPQLSKYYNNTGTFSKDLDNAYGIEETVLRMEEQQFTCVENTDGTIGADGHVRMTFERN